MAPKVFAPFIWVLLQVLGPPQQLENQTCLILVEIFIAHESLMTLLNSSIQILAHQSLKDCSNQD